MAVAAGCGCWLWLLVHGSCLQLGTLVYANVLTHLMMWLLDVTAGCGCFPWLLAVAVGYGCWFMDCGCSCRHTVVNVSLTAFDSKVVSELMALVLVTARLLKIHIFHTTWTQPNKLTSLCSI